MQWKEKRFCFTIGWVKNAIIFLGLVGLWKVNKEKSLEFSNESCKFGGKFRNPSNNSLIYSHQFGCNTQSSTVLIHPSTKFWTSGFCRWPILLPKMTKWHTHTNKWMMSDVWIEWSVDIISSTPENFQNFDLFETICQARIFVPVNWNRCRKKFNPTYFTIYLFVTNVTWLMTVFFAPDTWWKLCVFKAKHVSIKFAVQFMQ